MGLGFGALVCYGLGLKIVEELWGLLFGSCSACTGFLCRCPRSSLQILELVQDRVNPM